MRPFAFALLCALAAAGCRPEEDIPYRTPPPEEVTIDLQAGGCMLLFRLPDGWRRDASDPGFRGLRYRKGRESIDVRLALKERLYEELEARVRAEAPDAMRAFEAWTGWPFVGVVIAYHGPPDAAMLDAFRKSFRVERR